MTPAAAAALPAAALPAAALSAAALSDAPPGPGPGFTATALDLDGLRLAPWGVDLSLEVHAAAVERLAADPETARWNPVKLASFAEWLDARAAGWQDGDQAAFAVLDAGGALLGTAGMHWSTRDDGQAELGYRLLPEARGRGAATRATAALAAWAFAGAGARRIEVIHAVANPASCRVAERCGFLLEGTMRASYRYGDGVHHDEHLHARLAGDPEPVLPVLPGGPAR
ncbi:GNAT family N-acetyltransferase [Kitasatospora sp. NBC_01539]|uniref:GNAT family N-acetyltransferase n=1 Tax=Kitasatospora sp. NBC_01539 TaxID=2903577 RepID=UPI0038600FFE